MPRVSTLLAIKQVMSSDLITVTQINKKTRIHKETIKLALKDLESLKLIEREELPRTAWESNSRHSKYGWRLRI